METNKETLINNLELCKQNLIDAELDLYINNNDGKGWILPKELEGAERRIDDIIEYIEICIRNLKDV